jgi:hypothetical protein
MHARRNTQQCRRDGTEALAKDVVAVCVDAYSRMALVRAHAFFPAPSSP